MAYQVEMEKLEAACRQHPSSQSAALFAELARAAGKNEVLCSSIAEALKSDKGGFMASEFCCEVAAIVQRDSAGELMHGPRRGEMHRHPTSGCVVLNYSPTQLQALCKRCALSMKQPPR
jgi:hypothetical protein